MDPKRINHMDNLSISTQANFASTATNAANGGNTFKGNVNLNS